CYPQPMYRSSLNRQGYQVVAGLQRAGAGATVEVSPELPDGRLPLHGSDTAIANDDQPPVASFGLGDELLNQHLADAVPVQNAQYIAGSGHITGQDNALSLGALQQLDDERRAAHLPRCRRQPA